MSLPRLQVVWWWISLVELFVGGNTLFSLTIGLQKNFMKFLVNFLFSVWAVRRKVVVVSTVRRYNLTAMDLRIWWHLRWHRMITLWIFLLWIQIIYASDTIRVRRIQWTCSRFVWWRFSRNKIESIWFLLSLASCLDWIFIIVPKNKFIRRVLFPTYRNLYL